MKIAVVSGASSGIGMELVKKIDEKCPMLDEIWVIARRRERLEKLQFQVRRPLRIFPYDLSEKETLDKLKAALDSRHPRIFVVAAAAGFGKYGKNSELPLEDALGMIDVNVRGLTALVNMSLPWMVKGGRIILMGSAAAFTPQPGFGVYAATKAYVLSYGQSLGAELKKSRIHVTTVCPGPVKTEFFDHCGQGPVLSAAKVLFMADPKKVVRQAWKDSMSKKPVSVYGLPMKGFRAAAGLIPHRLIVKAMGLFV